MPLLELTAWMLMNCGETDGKQTWTPADFHWLIPWLFLHEWSSISWAAAAGVEGRWCLWGGRLKVHKRSVGQSGSGSGFCGTNIIYFFFDPRIELKLEIYIDRVQRHITFYSHCASFSQTEVFFFLRSLKITTIILLGKSQKNIFKNIYYNFLQSQKFIYYTFHWYLVELNHLVELLRSNILGFFPQPVE